MLLVLCSLMSHLLLCPHRRAQRIVICVPRQKLEIHNPTRRGVRQRRATDLIEACCACHSCSLPLLWGGGALCRGKCTLMQASKHAVGPRLGMQRPLPPPKLGPGDLVFDSAHMWMTTAPASKSFNQGSSQTQTTEKLQTRVTLSCRSATGCQHMGTVYAPAAYTHEPLLL